MPKLTDPQIKELADYYDTHELVEEIERAERDDTVTAEPMVVTSLRLPKPVMDALRDAARARGVGTTQLMREWLEERLAREVAGGDVAIPASALLAFVAERATRARQAS
ncbi:MAG: CopG family antitoxin [Streptosporangiaceae bacterium]